MLNDLAVGVHLVGSSCERRFIAVLGRHALHIHQVITSPLPSVSLQTKGLLFPSIRWHAGTKYAEKENQVAANDEHSLRHQDAKIVMKQINTIKIHRHWGQPYVRPELIEGMDT